MPAVNALVTTIRKHPLGAFFALAFVLTWILWVPMAFAGNSVSSELGLILIITGSFGPLFSAIIVTGLTRGKSGLRELKNGILKWRTGIGWYAAALLFPLIFAFIAYLLYLWLGGEPQDLSELQPWYNYFPALLFVLLLGGGLEEPGWRGFALPRLQARYSALTASIILGVIWALWHLPAFFSPYSAQSDLPFGWYLLHTIALSVILTWLFNGTRGSILMAMLLHAGLNAVGNWLPLYAGGGAISQFAAIVVIEYILVLALVILFKPSHLSRHCRIVTPSLPE